ncbi:HU family DNA-binding protein [Dysgonomonas sp. BGC7]|uniref:HU family DNA-binding protein n=1 Tax=Dysgonomonas sp. BGC7 TaxID=1658008 RepID=UPI000682B2DC|nr:HU family DNA-binding protein [Dysgonomonas sp. BGC7]MBD8389529.1 HU family DNA-binding protein [Dysgonomonas sp. BGC7]
MNERLSLQDLIDLLAKQQNITKKDAELFLRELIAVISENIEKGESVKIKDFGVFKLVKVNARKSVDVNTGEAIEIPAHYKLSFVPDKLLKEAVNRPFSHFESVVLEDGVTFDDMESTTDDSDEEEQDAVSNNEEENIEKGLNEDISNIVEDHSETEPEIITVSYTEEIIEIPVEEENQFETKAENSDSLVGEKIEEILPEVEDREEIIPHKITYAESTYMSAEESVFEEENEKSRNKKKVIGYTIAFLLIALIGVGIFFSENIRRYLQDGVWEKETKIVISYENKPLKDITSEKKDSIGAVIIVPVADSSAIQKPIETNHRPQTQKPQTDNKPLTMLTIASGHTLRNISLEYYGHKSFWIYIYEENKDKIKNPNNVPLGTQLVIPAPSKYGIDVKNKDSVKKARAKEEEIFAKMGL